MALNSFTRKLTAKFNAIKTWSDTTVKLHTHPCQGPAMSGGCGVTFPDPSLAGVVYPPPTRNLVNATQEEYNTTVAWLNQMFVNDTLTASETGDTLNMF